MMRPCLLAIAVAGCSTRLKTGAALEFSKINSCPTDRISVTERPDIAPHTIYEDDVPVAVPPADIAADPGRLKVWQSNQTQPIDIDAIATVFDVKGCDKETRFACAHPTIGGRHNPFLVEVAERESGATFTFHTDYYYNDKGNYVYDFGKIGSVVICMPAKP